MGAEFEGKKVVVVGGSAGMGRQAAVDVVDSGGSAVIVGRSKDRVDQTVAELTGCWSSSSTSITDHKEPAGQRFRDKLPVGHFLSR
ncbi:NAD(P)-dependent dehydrogenase (short-subunit alcohol dehydrogenase family) [Mycobacterium sp. URHB0021]